MVEVLNLQSIRNFTICIKKVDAELLELQETAGAYDYCKSEYIKANQDLIDAEKEKARQRELFIFWHFRGIGNYSK